MPPTRLGSAALIQSLTNEVLGDEGQKDTVLVGGLAISAQDKYTVKVPGGLAFSEFRGGDMPCSITTARPIRSSPQDHRRMKQRIRPMLGFKRFDNAEVTISGIELAEKIKKGQFMTGKLGGYNATMTELWSAALAA